MIIAGFDPGLRQTGYAILRSDRSGPMSVVDAGVITSDASGSLPDRLAQISEALDAILDEHSPRLAAVEQLYSHYKHPRTAILMGHARGVILLAAARQGIPVQDFSATQIKKSLTGNGRASKAQMQRAVRLTLGLDRIPEPADVADAIAIALTADLMRRTASAR